MKELLGLQPGATIEVDSGDKRSTKSKEVDFAVGTVDALVVASVVYNPATLKWEWAQRPEIDIDNLNVSMGDVEKLLASSYWKIKKFDYTSGDMDYAGFNTDISAADGDTDWYLWKYTWVGGNCTEIKGPVIDSWTNRGSAF